MEGGCLAMASTASACTEKFSAPLPSDHPERIMQENMTTCISNGYAESHNGFCSLEDEHQPKVTVHKIEQEPNHVIPNENESSPPKETNPPETVNNISKENENKEYVNSSNLPNDEPKVNEKGPALETSKEKEEILDSQEIVPVEKSEEVIQNEKVTTLKLNINSSLLLTDHNNVEYKSFFSVTQENEVPLEITQKGESAKVIMEGSSIDDFGAYNKLANELATNIMSRVTSTLAVSEPTEVQEILSIEEPLKEIVPSIADSNEPQTYQNSSRVEETEVQQNIVDDIKTIDKDAEPKGNVEEEAKKEANVIDKENAENNTEVITKVNPENITENCTKEGVEDINISVSKGVANDNAKVSAEILTENNAEAIPENIAKANIEESAEVITKEKSNDSGDITNDAVVSQTETMPIVIESLKKDIANIVKIEIEEVGPTTLNDNLTTQTDTISPSEICDQQVFTKDMIITSTTIGQENLSSIEICTKEVTPTETSDDKNKSKEDHKATVEKQVEEAAMVEETETVVSSLTSNTAPQQQSAEDYFEEFDPEDMDKERRRIIDNQVVRMRPHQTWAPADFPTNPQELSKNSLKRSLDDYEQRSRSRRQEVPLSSPNPPPTDDEETPKKDLVDSDSILEKKEQLKKFWERKMMAEKDGSKLTTWVATQSEGEVFQVCNGKDCEELEDEELSQDTGIQNDIGDQSPSLDSKGDPLSDFSSLDSSPQVEKPVARISTWGNGTQEDAEPLNIVGQELAKTNHVGLSKSKSGGAESLIAQEIRQLREREDELKKMRERMGADKPQAPVQNGTKAISNGIKPIQNGVKTVENGVNPTENGVKPAQNGVKPSQNGVKTLQNGVKSSTINPTRGVLDERAMKMQRTVSLDCLHAPPPGYRRKTVSVKPLADNEDKPSYWTTGETPVEREIRLAREREDNLRREREMLNRGIQNSRETLTAPPAPRLRATNRIQQEIEEQVRKELDHRQEVRSPSPRSSSTSSAASSCGATFGPTGRRPTRPLQPRVSMQRFIASRGRELTFVPVPGPVTPPTPPARGPIEPVPTPDFEIRPPQVRKNAAVRKAVPADVMIKDELTAMRAREEELRQQRMRLLGKSHPNLSLLGTEDDETDRPAPPKTPQPAAQNGVDAQVGGPRKRSSLIAAWEQRIQANETA